MISTSKIFFTTIKTCVQYLIIQFCYLMSNALKRILTNVNLNLFAAAFFLVCYNSVFNRFSSPNNVKFHWHFYWKVTTALSHDFLLIFILLAGFLLSCITDKEARPVLTLYERLLHCLSCLLVPELWHDWDQRWLAGLSSSTVTVRRDYYGRQWAGARTEYRLELQTKVPEDYAKISQSWRRVSWLKAPTKAFTFKILLRLYASIVS